jgi:hypothetical protein
MAPNLKHIELRRGIEREEQILSYDASLENTVASMDWYSLSNPISFSMWGGASMAMLTNWSQRMDPFRKTS